MCFQTSERLPVDGGLGDGRKLGNSTRNSVSGKLGAARNPRQDRI